MKGRQASKSARNRGPRASGVSSFGPGNSNSQLNPHIRAYVFDTPSPPSTKSKPWLQNPDVPTAEEMLEEDQVQLSVNRLDKAWPNSRKYLQTHYELLREDAIAPLRDAIAQFKRTPEMSDDNHLVVYEKVYVTGFTFAPQGLATRIQFSTARAGKKIAWHQSKRLIAGSMVALTTPVDHFRKRCIMAVVAARPLENVMATPSQVDLYFPRPEEIEIDPQLELVMIEARMGYYEGSRHTMKALQKMSYEKFPMADHICKLKADLEPPTYLQADPVMNLSSTFATEAKQAAREIDIIQNWPAAPSDLVDESQWTALRQMLTTRLSIVQGPPGTGKTHVSVVGLRILLESKSPSDAPIIVAAQTNHALDQILRHISCFDENYIRLGGRSSNAEVKKHTLYEVRKREKVGPPKGSVFGRATKAQSDMAKEMIDTLAPLINQGTPCPFAPEVLRNLGIITPTQEESLAVGAAQWISSSSESAQDPMSIWVDRQLIPFKVVYETGGLDFEEEEPDDEYEQLKELEAERSVDDDENIEHLRGPYRIIEDAYKGRTTTSSRAQAEAQLAKHKDLWGVPQHARGAVYHLFQDRVKAAIRRRFREQARHYADVCRNLQVGKWERDAVLLQQANIVGMTTTGFSKYRPLVASLKPKIVLIEEAAEVIEGPVAAVCVDSLEHLILVGDHQQLQGHCNLRQLEEEFHLNVSMFERLVRNQMPFKTLTRQRRMDPEIRRILAPIYQDLEDHPTVIGRPSVPGMGDVRSFFFDHNWSEGSDSMLSKYNEQEADFVVGVFCYLVRGGLVPAHAITVLTFYNGQRKLILKKLKQKDFLAGEYLSVTTVDSYQGEENAVVLLSLVRSNEQGSIGFLQVANRICVALSRARLGFYLFGNVTQLSSDPLWAQVIEIMGSDPNRVGGRFPIQCTEHNRKSEVQHPRDWDGLYGCDQRCTELLGCGHSCPLTCHTFPHKVVICTAKCRRYLICGHPCGTGCSQECWCEAKCADFVRLSATVGTIAETPPGCSSGRPMEVRGSNKNKNANDPNVIRGPMNGSMGPGTSRPQPCSTEVGRSNSSSITSDHLARMSPERRLQSRTNWDAFANGGAQASDLSLDKSVLAQKQRLIEQNDDLISFQDDAVGNVKAAGRVANKNQTVLKNGRIRYNQEYLPSNGNFREGCNGDAEANSAARTSDPTTSVTTTATAQTGNLVDLD